MVDALSTRPNGLPVQQAEMQTHHPLWGGSGDANFYLITDGINHNIYARVNHIDVLCVTTLRKGP
jgi:hypothetical protein